MIVFYDCSETVPRLIWVNFDEQLTRTTSSSAAPQQLLLAGKAELPLSPQMRS